MDIEPLALSLAGVVAAALVLTMMPSLRVAPSDAYQLAADIWRVREAGGCVVRAYYLRGVTVGNGTVRLDRHVYWNGTLTIAVGPVASRGDVGAGYAVLRVCYNGSHVTLSPASP